MMQLIRITDPDDAFLKKLITLYEESFPLEERRPVEQLRRLIKSADSMHFNAVVLDGELCGLLCFGISKRSIIWNILPYILI